MSIELDETEPCEEGRELLTKPRFPRRVSRLVHGVAVAVTVSILGLAMPDATWAENAAGTPTANATPVATPSTTPEAPFGLTWLASKSQVEQLVGDLGPATSTPFGDSYVVAELPKNLTDQNYSILSFGYDDRLIRITAVGAGFRQDHDGSQIKARYAQLEEALEQKYGKGKSTVYTNPAFQGGGWGLGLSRKKNWMYTEYRADGMRIELSVFVESSLTFWRMIFEHLAGMERLEHRRRESEQKTL